MSTSQYGGICRIYQVGRKGEYKAYIVFCVRKNEKTYVKSVYLGEKKHRKNKPVNKKIEN